MAKESRPEQIETSPSYNEAFIVGMRLERTLSDIRSYSEAVFSDDRDSPATFNPTTQYALISLALAKVRETRVKYLTENERVTDSRCETGRHALTLLKRTLGAEKVAELDEDLRRMGEDSSYVPLFLKGKRD